MVDLDQLCITVWVLSGESERKALASGSTESAVVPTAHYSWTPCQIDTSNRGLDFLILNVGLGSATSIRTPLNRLILGRSERCGSKIGYCRC